MTDDVLSPADQPAPEQPDLARRSEARRWIGRGLAVLGIAILLSTGWVAWRSYQAYRHLDAAAGQVALLQTQIRNLDNIDLTKAQGAIDALQVDAAGAVGATRDPLFRLAAHLPWLGANLAAEGRIAAIVNGLAVRTAPSLIQVATTVRPAALAPKNGAIDVAPIAAAAGTLQQADAQVSSALTAVRSIDRRDLVAPVVRAVNTLQGKLTSLSSTTGAVARIGRLAPGLLGADGARRYLVVFQNLAEPRATGGIFGSYALLVTDHGKLSIADQGSASQDLGFFDPPLPASADLPTALYGAMPGTYPTDVNLTPDFPTAAGLIAKMYTSRTKKSLDGVLAIDPVALSYLLQGAAPIDVGHGLQLTSSTITSILLSKAYALYPQSKDAPARDRFLAAATTKAFAAVTSAPTNAAAALRGLTRAAAEHRLQLWSARPAEQTDLAATDLGTALPATDGAAPAVGVFRNDGTGGKLGYYAAGTAAVTTGSCTPGGQRNLTLTVVLRYAAPTAGLPPYVLGYKKAGPYVLRTNLLVFAPLQGGITAITVNGSAVPVAWATQGGRKVGMITVDQEPGQQATVVAALTAGASASVAPRFVPALVLTPGVSNWKSTVQGYAACAATP